MTAVASSDRKMVLSLRWDVDRIEEEQLRPTEAGPANGAAAGAFQKGETSHA